MDFNSLKHARLALPDGGKVVVIDTGALIGPESEAMLQALHSRSVGGIDEHLLKLAQTGAEKFMSRFYVGYGHKSIGDCGSATIFVEGVSMLAAKAIQDYRMYNGQESSTRYIDFAEQSFIDPVGTRASRAVLEGWRSLYLEGLEVLNPALIAAHPKESGEEQSIYEKAIGARAFDIMRGFLPAGASTNLAWHTELRHASDHLMTLRHHPLKEVRDVARTIEKALIKRFPSSFTIERYPATEAYNRSWMQKGYYFRGDESYRGLDGVKLARNGIWVDRLEEHRREFESRPPKTELPKLIAEAGVMSFEFLLDFGSFRDLQRHRSIDQRMPLLTEEYGFGTWYLERLPAAFRAKVVKAIASQVKKIRALSKKPEIRQYYLPMGMLVPCRTTGDISAFAYIVELRSGIKVHPTLRIIAQGMGKHMLDSFGRYGLVLYIDESADRFNVKRGKDDIIDKSAT